MFPEKQKTYLQAFALAKELFLDSPIPERAEKAGLTFSRDRNGFLLEIPFFDELISLRTSGMVFSATKGRAVNLVVRIILLHYLNTVTGITVGDEMISWEDIPALKHYGPAYERRILSPLRTAFATSREAFLVAGEAFGAKKEEYGDASFTLQALPRVPITLILWERDEEFPATIRVLYHPSVTSCLPFEDIVVLTKLAATRIIHKARYLSREEDV